jgi:hypothetical protein
MPPTKDAPAQDEQESGDWQPEAWVYFIWIVLGFQVYCKIGHSTRIRLPGISSSSSPGFRNGRTAFTCCRA